MATLEDVKIHLRSSEDDNDVYKHCFIAVALLSHADIVRAIYKRFGKDLKIQKIFYNDAEGDRVDVLDDTDFATMVRKNTITKLFITIDDIHGTLNL